MGASIAGGYPRVNLTKPLSPLVEPIGSIESGRFGNACGYNYKTVTLRLLLTDTRLIFNDSEVRWGRRRQTDRDDSSQRRNNQRCHASSTYDLSNSLVSKTPHTSHSGRFAAFVWRASHAGKGGVTSLPIEQHVPSFYHQQLLSASTSCLPHLILKLRQCAQIGSAAPDRSKRGLVPPLPDRDNKIKDVDFLV
eukprot:sb/3471051/